MGPFDSAAQLTFGAVEHGKLAGPHVTTSNATPTRLTCWFVSKGSTLTRLTTDRLLPVPLADCCAVPWVRCYAKPIVGNFS
jgi:hypothetical protein